MRALHVTIGFACFTAIMIIIALSFARSRPLWLVTTAIVLGVLVVVHAGLMLHTLEARRALTTSAKKRAKRK